MGALGARKRPHVQVLGRLMPPHVVLPRAAVRTVPAHQGICVLCSVIHVAFQQRRRCAGGGARGADTRDCLHGTSPTASGNLQFAIFIKTNVDPYPWPTLSRVGMV